MNFPHLKYLFGCLKPSVVDFTRCSYFSFGVDTEPRFPENRAQNQQCVKNVCNGLG